MLEFALSREMKLDFDRLHKAISVLRTKQIFFVGGTMKSGTTWLQLLLDAHPEVSCNGEGHFADRLAPLLKEGIAHHAKFVADKNRMIFEGLAGYPQLTEEDYLYILASSIALYLLQHSRAKENAAAIGERTPDNIEHMDMLAALFPAAKFIQIVRDGRDCAVSGWFHNLRVTPVWTLKNYGSLGAYASWFAAAWADQLVTAQQFADKYQDRFIRVRYEDIVTHPERVLKILFDFLGVNCDEGMLTSCQHDASFVKLSGGRKPGQEDRRSFFRKGITGDWRNHLSVELQADFQKQARGWIERLGYF